MTNSASTNRKFLIWSIALLVTACYNLAEDVEKPADGAGTDKATGGDADTDGDTDVDTDADTDADLDAIACTAENAVTVCGGQFCTDGYCCNAACDGFCEACDVPGSKGTCTPVPSGQDLDDECPAEDVYTCGRNGSCDGAGGCEMYGLDDVCAGTDFCTVDGYCDGNGICVAVTVKPDFTPCEVITSPNDRSYDICVAGRCVSPGCGDVTCNAPGPHFPLADTNQRLCYNDSSEMACPTSSTEAFFGQDAQYGWDVEHEASERFNRDVVTSPGYPVVTDNVTGLIWQGCALGYSGDDCSTTGSDPTSFTWEDALIACDSLAWGGYTQGWRLPDEYELDSIVDDGRNGPAIDTDAFPATPSSYFWSSSTYAGDTSYAWDVSGGKSNTNSNNVRCVRSGP